MLKSQQKTFIWSGINSQGKRFTGEITAKDQAAATAQLHSQHFILLSLSKKRFTWLTAFKQRIKPLHLTLFFRQFAALLTAGVTLIQSLMILEQTCEPHSLKETIKAIRKDIEIGKLLSNSMQTFHTYFDHFVCQCILVGEQTGTLDDMLTKIAGYTEKKYLLHKKILQALLYPSIILLVAIGVSLIMLIIVVPTFAELFAGYEKLPALTRMVLFTSSIIRHYSWIGLLIFIVSIGLLKITHKVEYVIDWIKQQLLKIPIMGEMFNKHIMINFALNLSISCKSGLPITTTLKLLSQTAKYPSYHLAFSQLQSEISKGISLHLAMTKHSIFPPLLVQMVKIGEESGTLSKMLAKVADIYESDIEYLIRNLMQLLEPLIMVILGVLIGILVIAMYLPIFKLGTLM